MIYMILIIKKKKKIIKKLSLMSFIDINYFNSKRLYSHLKIFIFVIFGFFFIIKFIKIIFN